MLDMGNAGKPELLTIGGIAKRLGITHRQAEFAAQKITETCRAGIIRLYDPGKVREITKIIESLAARKSARRSMKNRKLTTV